MGYDTWKKRLTLTIFDGHDRKLKADVVVDVYYEDNYGADADGNRGISVTTYEDYFIYEIRDEEGRQVPETEFINKNIEDALNEADLSKEE